MATIQLEQNQWLFWYILVCYKLTNPFTTTDPYSCTHTASTRTYVGFQVNHSGQMVTYRQIFEFCNPSAQGLICLKTAHLVETSGTSCQAAAIVKDVRTRKTVGSWSARTPGKTFAVAAVLDVSRIILVARAVGISGCSSRVGGDVDRRWRQTVQATTALRYH